MKSTKRIARLIHSVRYMMCGGVLMTLTGCFGVVGTGYYDGPGYWGDYGTDVTIFGGYRGGHWDRDAGRRGFESRGGIGHGGHRHR